MSILIKRILFILPFCLLQIFLHATHNRAGEITYQQIDELTIRATITTYTKTSSQGADRDTVEIFWGDGTSEFVKRTNGNGFPQPNDIKINYYIAEHTYPGRGTYTLAMRDPNRVINILNITNSVNIPFFIQTQFTLLNTQFQGVNNSAVLLQAPIDFACAGQRFIHNPNAYDIDGDSLSYQLVTPFQERGGEVPEYFAVDQIRPVGDNNIATLNPETGDFIWDAPQTQGEYNITIKINEYRDGVFINSIIRDMQIFVRACDNRPPEIESIDEICVIAGEEVSFNILVTDVDEGQKVSLSATGGPFLNEDNSAEQIAILRNYLQHINYPNYRFYILFSTDEKEIIRRENYAIWQNHDIKYKVLFLINYGTNPYASTKLTFANFSNVNDIKMHEHQAKLNDYEFRFEEALKRAKKQNSKLLKYLLEKKDTDLNIEDKTLEMRLDFLRKNGIIEIEKFLKEKNTDHNK